MNFKVRSRRVKTGYGTPCEESQGEESCGDLKKSWSVFDFQVGSDKDSEKDHDEYDNENCIKKVSHIPSPPFIVEQDARCQMLLSEVLRVYG